MPSIATAASAGPARAAEATGKQAPLKSRGDAPAHATPLPAWPARGAPVPAWGAFLTELSGDLVITLALIWPVVRHIASCFPADLGDPPNEYWLAAWTVHSLTTDPSALL